jgi:Ca2+-binding RTX toxin-like protein
MRHFTIRATIAAGAATVLVGAFAFSATSASVVIRCEGNVPTITGTEADDILVGTAGRDVIAGLGGDDMIRGSDDRTKFAAVTVPT